MTKYYIAGHRGMVGSAIFRQLQADARADIVIRSHAQLDLTNQLAVRDFMQVERPDVVILAAGKVGGIHANNAYPAEFIYENLMIECNVIHQAYAAGVKKLLQLGSSCIYPRDVPQPMCEDALLTGTLEPTNEPYAVAKIAGIKLCESYNRQHGWITDRSCQQISTGPEITSTPMIATSYPLSSAVSTRPREMAWMRLLFGAAAPRGGNSCTLMTWLPPRSLC